MDVPESNEIDGVKISATQKIAREQVLRQARKQVQGTIEGWAKLFKGDTGKDYFEVGKVKREPGWLEKLPKRKLCEQAQKGRPKPKEKGEKGAKAGMSGQRPEYIANKRVA